MLKPWFLFLSLILFGSLTSLGTVGINTIPKTCKLSLGENWAFKLTQGLNDYSQGRLWEADPTGHTVISPGAKKDSLIRLQKYLSQMDLRELSHPQNHPQIAAHLLEIVYGDKFSLWKRLPPSSKHYQQNKYELIVKEYLLTQGLNDFFKDLSVDDSGSLRDLFQKSKVWWVQSRMKWILDRALLRPLAYDPIPTELIEAVLKNGWEQSRPVIAAYFQGSQKKRDFLNDLQRPLSKLFASLMVINTYYSVYEAQLESYTTYERSYSQNLEDLGQILHRQRHQLDLELQSEGRLLQDLMPPTAPSED